MVRGGEVSARELVELYLERIERLDPELNAFRVVMAERALADAQQADGRRGAGDERPLLGVPIAVKDSEDVIGEVTTWGTAGNSTPAAQDSELVRRLKAAGAVVDRQDELPRARDHGRHRGPRVRHHPQSVGHRAGRRRLERRQRRGRGRGHVRRRHGVGRHRLDPHPGGRLRIGRAQAHPRPHPARAAEGALVRPERRGLRDAQRGGPRAPDERRRRRGGPARRARPHAGAGCASPSPRSRRFPGAWAPRSAA